jgi:predicted outer membrane repeat protein
MKITRLAALIPFTIAAGAQFTGARAATLTVCPSGCEHTTIQGAISHASNGDTISIGKGHYFERVNTQGKTLTLAGVDARQVVVDANGTGSVITIPGTNPVTISDLTVTRGSGRYDSSSPNGGAFGGGISITESASLTLTNSNVIGNYSTVGGGGVFCFAGNLKVIGSTIADNQGPDNGGGGIFFFGNTLGIDSSTIARNVGGGIVTDVDFGARGTQILTVDKSSIVDNSQGGGITAGVLTLTVSNSTIAGNSTDGNGGGMSNVGADTTLKNVVVTRNTAGGQGGGIYAAYAYTLHGQTIPSNVVFQNAYVVLNSAGVDGGGTYIQGTVTNDGVDVAGNLPDNCAKGTICP